MTSSEVFLYLTTRGHRSGQPHEIEIWFVRQYSAYYIVSEKGEAAHWVQNLRAQSAVHFYLSNEPSRAAHARVVDEPALIAIIKAKMDAKYGWSNGLVVEIAPT
ncbi:MAG: nitroreductase/quinone reductase family protein [Chloroflexi bacterium]|nr:nitroreductase/quinone reductase family protein [Chloroflexota bacterium]MCY3582662.1 nitroreductase/quinone reductase family protein [Chloroflexota bacterium]MCY3717777.1 nitroreductase/quinone reductase family protein [Chloroflexota bacterium]MDE2651470.1 nitroreductase/quinone reductase family protein [Chloroflexota bacterium]